MPKQNKIIFLLLAIVFLVGGVFFLKSGTLGTKVVWGLSNGGTWLLPLIVVSSLIDSINPCAFSILFLTLAFLFSLGKMRNDILKIGGSYIFGLFVIYIFIGLGILQALHIFSTPHFMAKLGAGIMISLGSINLINHFFPKFPLKLKIPSVSHEAMAKLMEKASLPTAFILGGLVGLCEFPCTGGPYLMVLGLLHDTGKFWQGFGYLLIYNLIFVLPLALILFAASNKAVLEKMNHWKKNNVIAMRVGGGIAMIVLGLFILLL